MILGVGAGFVLLILVAALAAERLAPVEADAFERVCGVCAR
jgi:hypothetical protein